MQREKSVVQRGIGHRSPRRWRPSGEAITWLATVGLMVTGSLLPAPDAGLFASVALGFLQLTPVIAISAVLAGFLAISQISERVSRWMGAGNLRGIVVGSLGGAVTPLCGLGTVPLIAVLLRRGIPLPAVMAFWVSSPVTDPGMFAITAGILGVPFAVAKATAAFGIGLFAGAASWTLPVERWSGGQLLRTSIAQSGCNLDATTGGWRSFGREALDNVRLIARWLALALVLEVFVQRYVPPELIQSALGSGSDLAIPLAAIVGAPLYLDGYAALPLVRGLVELGMTAGAAMALLISGAAVSLYAAVAVFSLVRWPVFVLYVALAVIGATLAGYGVAAIGVPIATE